MKKVIAAASKFKDGFRHEMRNSVVTAIIAALGFMIALVWRDVISGYVGNISARMKIAETSMFYSVWAAVITTVICVLGLVLVSKWASKKE